MDRNAANDEGKKYKSIEQLIKDAYGLNADQMMWRMEWALQEARSSCPLKGRPIIEPSKDEFQKIQAKMAARGITPKVLADFDEESQRRLQDEGSWERNGLLYEWDGVDGRESWGARAEEIWDSVKMVLRRPVKVAGAAAACFLLVAAIILLPKIDAIAKRNFSYGSRVRDGNTGSITWNNQKDHITDVGSLEEAYAKIKEESDIAVLKLSYIPGGMILSDFDIQRENIRLDFSYIGNHVYVFQILYSVDNTSTRVSDCQEYMTVFNEWLDREIPVQRRKRQDGRSEYMAYLEIDDAYYYIQGSIPEEDFLRIVENLVLDLN